MIFEHCFQHFPANTTAKIKDPSSPLISFYGHSLWPHGTITLPLTMEDYKGSVNKTIEAEFVVVQAPSPCNIILSRAGLRKLKIVPSTLHGLVKISTANGVGIIFYVPLITPHCNQIMYSEQFDLGHKWQRDHEDEEFISKKYPDQPINIGVSLPSSFKKELKKLLRENMENFA